MPMRIEGAFSCCLLQTARRPVGETVVCHDDLRWLDQMSRGDTHRLKRRSEDGLLIPSRDDERDEMRMWHGVLGDLS